MAGPRRPSGVMSRRQILAFAGVAALSGCAGRGSTAGAINAPGGRTETASLVRANLARQTASASARTAGVGAVTSFSADLLAAVAGAGSSNLVCSPYSVAVALGMTAQGAKGTTAKQMLGVLHAQDAAALAGGLNGIAQALAGRAGPVPNPSGGAPEQLLLAAADSVWGQRGEAWQPAFLDVLARDFGTGMRAVDYTRPEAARTAINTWVSQQTHARIPDLIPAGALSAATRLTLVNALYLKAPWQNPFETGQTQQAPFHRLDDSTATVALMNGSEIGDRYAEGDGWVAADLPYARGELAMTVVVPDTGRFTQVRRALAGGLLPELRTKLQPAPVQVALPKWTTRTQLGLQDVLSQLGMPIAFTRAADFSAMTTADELSISAVVHEGYIAVDEAGTEAAAATGVVMRASAARVGTAYTLRADRPFLYVVRDRPTGTPLFVGQVLDPST